MFVSRVARYVTETDTDQINTRRPRVATCFVSLGRPVQCIPTNELVKNATDRTMDEVGVTLVL